MTRNTTTRIMDRLAENKSSIKTYANYHAAARVAEAAALRFEEGHQEIAGNSTMTYTVAGLPTGRFTAIFHLSRWVNGNTGTYMGYFAQQGFFSD